MQLSIICFSLTGYTTALKLAQGLQRADHKVQLYKKSKYLDDSIKESTAIWTGGHFHDDGIIFVGACGIAVRSIASYVTSKKTDPAVLVIDECGRFVISLLSGHLGGANELTLKSAEVLGAVPVVTTATDLHHRFAVDVFAKENSCVIMDMKAAKEVSAALLAGRPVGFYSEFPWKGELPEGLKEFSPDAENRPDTGVAVTIHPSCRPFASTVQIVPRAVTLGMGCRRDKEADVIEEEACACLKGADIYRQAVEKLTSISIKKEEKGLIKLAKSWEIPFVTYEEKELRLAEGEFSSSEFVKTITGIDNVCERSAVLGAEQGTLIKNKTGRNGVTTALALRNWEVHFE